MDCASERRLLGTHARILDYLGPLGNFFLQEFRELLRRARDDIDTLPEQTRPDIRRAHRATDRVVDFFKLARATHANLSEYIHLSIARHNWEATHRLGDVRVPTLVLIGTNDKARSNHLLQAEALKNRIPGAELKVLEGQSHGFFWQAPEETNQAILDWVRRHSG